MKFSVATGSTGAGNKPLFGPGDVTTTQNETEKGRREHRERNWRCVCVCSRSCSVNTNGAKVTFAAACETIESWSGVARSS